MNRTRYQNLSTLTMDYSVITIRQLLRGTEYTGEVLGSDTIETDQVV